MLTDQDHHFISQAIALGNKGRITAPPNPWVGCVIVKNGEIIGEGYHHKAGDPHAEVIALRQAGANAEGATVYITLEPCTHHGRTPPCVDALISAKVKRVVYALKDPDPRVSGQSEALLKSHGIEVTKVENEQAFQSLQPYLHQRSTGKPFCIGKMAMSLDGRTAAADGTSKWITTDEARYDVQKLRAESQAIIIGTGTALKDNPELTVREKKFQPLRAPLRVLMDATGKVLPKGKLFDLSLAPTLIFTSSSCHPATLEAWKKAGIEVIEIAAKEGFLDVDTALKILGQRGIIQLLVEGGSTLMGSFLKAGAINRLTIYVGSILLGDSGYPLLKNLTIPSMDKAPKLKLVSCCKIGNDVKLEYDFSS